jgi:hypothetical protein
MRRYLGIALVLFAAVPGTTAAQASSPDFMFKPPRFSISVRGSWDFLRTGSDWFDFVEKQLTLDRNDFALNGISGDVSFRVRPRFDLVAGVDYLRRTTGSEYRDFVDNNRQPIEQNTRLREASITGGVRYALRERGRAIGSLAWLPTRVVPYVGGGFGVLVYDLNQYGDFVDFVDFSVFGTGLPSSGATPLYYADGGAEIQLIKHLYLSIDARYKWAHSELDEPAWTGFEPLDLGGVRLSTGATLTF